MDTSNLPADHPRYRGERKKIPGLFKDETGIRAMYEFIALLAKPYVSNIEEKLNTIAKGIRGHAIKNYSSFDDYNQRLLEIDDEEGRNEVTEQRKRFATLEALCWNEENDVCKELSIQR